MKLVLNGLSQNSFITLDEKVEIIQWYKSYFSQNEEAIREALKAEEYIKNIGQIENKK